MGRSYWFECSRCGYRARVSGGPDRGLELFVQTVLCRECKELYDAVIKIRGPDELAVRLRAQASGLSRRALKAQARRPPDFMTALNRIRLPGARHHKWTHYSLQCPVSPAHKIEPWDAPDKCPRCGLYLEKNALPYRIWD